MTQDGFIVMQGNGSFLSDSFADSKQPTWVSTPDGAHIFGTRPDANRVAEAYKSMMGKKAGDIIVRGTGWIKRDWRFQMGALRPHEPHVFTFKGKRFFFFDDDIMNESNEYNTSHTISVDGFEEAVKDVILLGAGKNVYTPEEREDIAKLEVKHIIDMCDFERTKFVKKAYA